MSSHVCKGLYQVSAAAQPFNVGPTISAAAAAKSLQSGLTLCNPMDCKLPGSSDQGILQAGKYWNGLPCPPAENLPDPGIKGEGLLPLLHWQVSSLPLAPPRKTLGPLMLLQMAHYLIFCG